MYLHQQIGMTASQPWHLSVFAVEKAFYSSWTSKDLHIVMEYKASETDSKPSPPLKISGGEEGREQNRRDKQLIHQAF
jgi:hypothetical protein